MKICVIGTGYVGLVVGTCFAEMGNGVVCVDIDQSKIRQLKKGRLPIFEPGLEELVHRNLHEARLEFSTQLKEAVERSLVIFIAVGTPAGDDGTSDLKYVLAAAESVGRSMNSYKILVNKSTVPVGTADRIRKLLTRVTRQPFDVASNPEFLKEGSAVDDFLRPDRVVIGSEDVRVAEILRKLYRPFVRTGAPVLAMDTRSA
ncbi:MAG: nucleotide sugar dehydrogenase, partial [Acidobacteriota bacterium]